MLWLCFSEYGAHQPQSYFLKALSNLCQPWGYQRSLRDKPILIFYCCNISYIHCLLSSPIASNLVQILMSSSLLTLLHMLSLLSRAAYQLYPECSPKHSSLIMLLFCLLLNGSLVMTRHIPTTLARSFHVFTRGVPSNRKRMTTVMILSLLQRGN